MGGNKTHQAWLFHAIVLPTFFVVVLPWPFLIIFAFPLVEWDLGPRQ